MVYGGKSLAEIAGYSTRQLRAVIGLERDDHGNLIRDRGLPTWIKVDAHGFRVVPQGMRVPYEVAAKQVWKSKGIDPDQAWESFLEDHPDFGKSRRHNGGRSQVRDRSRGR